MKFRTMMKKTIITILIIFLVTSPLLAQNKQQETVLKREVTLYNPYKPSLQDVAKKSYLPDIVDTTAVKPVFKYDLRPEPYMPSYTINPLKPVSLVPDPLSRLYNSYINFGLGNYLTPLAEICITKKELSGYMPGIIQQTERLNFRKIRKVLPVTWITMCLSSGKNIYAIVSLMVQLI